MAKIPGIAVEKKPKKTLTMAEVKYWLGECDSWFKRRDNELKERNHYPDLIQYYEGESTLTNNERASVICDYFPNTNELIATIMYQNPEITVQPVNPQAEDGTEVMRAALNYAWKNLDALTENRICLFDMIYAGFAGMEVAYVNLPDETDEAQGALLTKKTLISKFFGKTDSDDKVEEEQAKTEPEDERNYASKERTYWRRTNPMDIIMDYRAERVKDCRFIGKVIRYTVAEFETRYPEFKGKIKAGEGLKYSLQELDDNKKTVRLYNIQIKKRGGHFVNVVLCPDYIYGAIDVYERPYAMNGFNIKIGTLHEYGKLIPISVAQVNKAIHDDLVNYHTFLMEVAERNIPKRWVLKGQVSQDAMAHLTNRQVNDVVEVNGPNAIGQVPHTNITVENALVLASLQTQSDKLWAISQTRLTGASDAKFATELEIQEAGFQQRHLDIQNGLRAFIVQQVDAAKDIIVQFWDDAIFLKVTGGAKPGWYTPEVAADGTVLNPLTDMLVRDYDVEVDISSALRPNRERQKKETVEFLTWVTGPQMTVVLQAGGLQVNPEELKKVAKDFGFNPETLFIQAPPQVMPGMEGAGGIPGEGVPGESPLESVPML